MMLARYKKIANFTFLARWANLALSGLEGIGGSHRGGTDSAQRQREERKGKT